MYNFTLAVDEKICLVQPTFQMAAEIFTLIDEDRDHLREYLDFVDLTKEVKDEENYLKMKFQGYAQGTDRLFFIAYEGKLVGTIDLHFIDSVHHKAEVGYWLSSRYTRKGIMTKVVNKLSEIAFFEMGLNKLTIVADVENYGSNRIAQGCNYTLVGTKREDILMYERYRDMNHYSLLKSEFMPDVQA